MRKGQAGPLARGAGVSLRLRILFGFALATAVTAGLGVFAAQSVARSGALGAAAFDQARAAASLARSAEAGVAALDAALLRRRSASTAGARQAEDERIAVLAKRVAEDLRTVADRATSDAVRRAAAGVDAATVAWVDAARSANRQPSPDWARLAPFAAAAKERLDTLVDLMAGDALRRGEEARAAAVAATRATAAATLVALLFGCGAAAWLARRVAGPIAAASRAASDIAAGRFDTPMPEGGGELAALLTAMGRMRDFLGDGIAREKAAALDAQARLAEAMEASTEGFVLTDAAGRISAANRRVARLLPDFDLAPGANWDRAASALHVPDPAMAAALWHAPPAAAELKLPGGRWIRVSRSPEPGARRRRRGHPVRHHRPQGARGRAGGEQPALRRRDRQHEGV